MNIYCIVKAALIFSPCELDFRWIPGWRRTLSSKRRGRYI